MLGIKVFEFAPFVEERLKAAPHILAELDADILLLQEVFGKVQRLQLAAVLADLYPYSACSERTPPFGLGDGLLLLSRYPVERQCVFSFRRCFLEERVIGGIGFQSASVLIPEFGALDVFNVHLTAGGAMHTPHFRRAERLRANQIAELVQVAATSRPCHLLGGDFNAGPEISPANYQQLIAAGYMDCFSENSERPNFTWDVRNPLNANGPHRHCPSQRMDHVFLSSSAKDKLAVTRAEIMLDKPRVQLATGETCTVSDHYAVRVTFRFDL